MSGSKIVGAPEDGAQELDWGDLGSIVDEGTLARLFSATYSELRRLAASVQRRDLSATSQSSAMPQALSDLEAEYDALGKTAEAARFASEARRTRQRAIPLLRAARLAPYVNFVTERSLTDDLTRAGFDVLETGMYPEKSRSFFVVARKAG